MRRPTEGGVPHRRWQQRGSADSGAIDEIIRKLQFGRDVEHLRDAEAHDRVAQPSSGGLNIRLISRAGSDAFICTS